MCLEAELPPESQPGSLVENTQGCVPDLADDVSLRGARQPSPSIDGSDHTEAEKSDSDVNDRDKQENCETPFDPVCPVCSEIFNNRSEYTVHLKKHTDGTKCLVCGKTLSSANSLDRHLLVHSGEKPFECEHCGKSFTTNGNMNRHKRKRKHTSTSECEQPDKKRKISNNDVVECEQPEKKGKITNSGRTECEQPDKKRKINKDSRKVNPAPVSLKKGRLHNCEYCPYGFANAIQSCMFYKNYSLVFKMDCERRRICPHNPNRGDDKEQNTEEEAAKVCETCGDLCLRTSELHPESHDEKEFIMCKICNAGFYSPEKFKLHELHHEKSMQNQVIDTDVKNQENKDKFLQMLELCDNKILKEVQRSRTPTKSTDETNEQPATNQEKALNSLPHCERDCRNHPTDQSTITSPASETVCSVTSPVINSDGCELTVTSPASKAICSVTSPVIISEDCTSLNSTPVKAPASPVGESSASEQCVLDSELKCTECGECFQTKKLLKIHYHKIHLRKNTFSCPQCPYVSIDKSTLTRHLRIHTGERPYMCVVCRKKFTTETNAKRHVKKKHNVLEKHKKYIVYDSGDKSNGNDGNTKCPYCSKDFGNSKLLSQHKNSPDCPGKAYICPVCPMRFPTKNNCLRHMTHQHKLKKDEAKNMMIINKLAPNNKIENNQRLQNLEQTLNAADSEVKGHNGSDIHFENVTEDQNNHDDYIINLANFKENHANNVQSEMSDMIVDAEDSPTDETEDTDVSSVHSNPNTVCQRPSSTEVDVSYSMLKLSESTSYQKIEPTSYQKIQEEPLDLRVRPMDLSTKNLDMQNDLEKHPRIFSRPHIPLFRNGLLSSTPKISPLGQSFPGEMFGGTPTRKVFSPPLPNHPKPPFASEGFFHSDHTRNNFMYVPELRREATDVSDNAIPLLNSSIDGDDSDGELVIVEDAASNNSSNDNSVTRDSSLKQYSTDNEITDLASVSSVIDTANSQDISKFLNPVTFKKTHFSRTPFSVSSDAAKSNICRNSGDSCKKFLCEECKKSFDTSSALRRHQDTHTGIKKYICSICSKRFGTKSNCKRHERTHLPKSSQKPRGLPNESQNARDINNNGYADFSIYNGTNPSDSFDHSNDVTRNTSSRSPNTGHFNPSSNTSATFSHLLSENFSFTQNLECKFCMNTYKNEEDLTNHVRELHPLEYTGKIDSSISLLSLKFGGSSRRRF